MPPRIHPYVISRVINFCIVFMRFLRSREENVYGRALWMGCIALGNVWYFGGFKRLFLSSIFLGYAARWLRIGSSAHRS